MAKVLVTGATGFIGNYVVQQLLYNNHQVIATSSNEEKAKTFDWFGHVAFIPLNLENFDNSVDYFQFFNSPDVIIHLAWQGLPNYTSLFHFENNLPRDYAFLKNLITHGAKDITITGTCFEYGMKQGLLTEDMLSAPANPYALAKDTLRKFLLELQKKQPFNLKWIRLFYMYGKGQNENSLFSQLDRALANGETVFNMSGGEQVRDYLPVTKVAENITIIATQNNVQGIINCCSNMPITVKKLIQDYLKNSNQQISLNLGFYPYADYEPMAFWGDDTKLKIILNNEQCVN
ncbi:MAG TPA: NAD-dependent epimerase/dehydratase family protein [Chitinophagaceae bacterium]|nr:NAD-dependent epimerase/dehydratase family protein [Chitinophagaceae bacterium]